MNHQSQTPWVIRLNSNAASALGQLRLVNGLKVLIDEESLWVRGDSWDNKLSQRIRSISDAEWFAIRADHQLTRRDETVPCLSLPKGEWQPLQSWIELKLPRAGFAPKIIDRTILRLVRSTSPRAANLLETNWDIWHHYAITAPQIRLARLSFAVSDKDRVLVCGTPLPPISGHRFAEENGLIIPVGWKFAPDVGSTIARRILELEESELALFSEEGSFVRLPQSAFVGATRSAVRMTNGR